MKTGKEKKKKKSISSIQDEEKKQMKPQRVSNQINVSVRQQIAWAKAYKRLISTSSSSTNVVAKKFKKERTAKEEKEEYIEVDYESIKPPVVFVDGYNIIGYINSVQGSGKLDIMDARDCLISDLAILSGATGWEIECVFDAYKLLGPEKKEIIDGIAVTYTGRSETADTYIERRFHEMRSEGFQNMVVATDDSVLRMIAGTSGSGYLPASMLLEEFRIAYQGWDDFETFSIELAEMNKPRLGDMLSNEIKAELEKIARQYNS